MDESEVAGRIRGASVSIQKMLLTNGPAVGYRILSLSLSLMFFAAYSKAVFILFMGKEGFFSYDLLTSGTIGIEVFFFTTELMLLFIAVLAVGVLIPILRVWWRRKMTWSDFSVLVGLAVGGAFFWRGITPALSHVPEKDFPAWGVLLLLSLLICFHLAVLFCRPPKDGLRSLLVLLFALTGLTVVAHEEMVGLLQFGLKAFGVGGEISVSMHIGGDDSKSDKKGRLLFLSPEHAYVVLDGEKELSIIHRSGIEIIKVASRKEGTK